MELQPSRPEHVVRAFVAAWNRQDINSIIDLIGEEIRYHNIPLEELVGKPTVASYLCSLPRFDSCTWELHALAVDGARVLTERTDVMVIAGTRIVLPVMGIFVVEHGLIVAWRDYFDLASYRAQWPKENNQ